MSTSAPSLMRRLAEARRVLARPSHAGGQMPLALPALFVLVVLVALVISAQTYGRIVEVSNRMGAERLACQLVSAHVKANPLAEAVHIAPGPEGQVLVLERTGEAGQAFEVRLYLYQGQLMEEYAFAQNPLNPQAATALVPLDAFELALESGLLQVDTSAGSVSVALRSIATQPALAGGAA